MGLEREAFCPSCDQRRSFYRTAGTSLHLGEKSKWACSECGFGAVEIDGVVQLPEE